MCLHGFMDSWRTWTLVLPALERRHEVYAPTLPGHAGGPPFAGDMVDTVARMLDDAGLETAHLVGNSLGGWLALALAARGRARSVVAFAPAGGWTDGGQARAELFAYQRSLQEAARAAAPHADTLAQGEVRAHQLMAVARCPAAAEMLDAAATADWTLDTEAITCPIRVVWGTADRLLPWPAAAQGLRIALPQADWVELEDVGHYPQLDAPLEAAELILGVSG